MDKLKRLAPALFMVLPFDKKITHQPIACQCGGWRPGGYSI
jgi:hypothetical protein